jgi:hypothetical protein
VPSTASLAICGTYLYKFNQHGQICTALELFGNPRQIRVLEKTFPLRYAVQTLGVASGFR